MHVLFRYTFVLARYLIDMSKAFNQQFTATTMLEKWRATGLIEPQRSACREIDRCSQTVVHMHCRSQLLVWGIDI